MKAWLVRIVELLLVVLLVPQAFVLSYYFSLLFEGGNWLGLLKTLSLYALTVSWVSAPVLVVLTILVRILIGAKIRWLFTLSFSVSIGYLWVAAWNLFVYPVFSYGRSTVPILLCAGVATGYAQARTLYREAFGNKNEGEKESGNQAESLPE